jgi:ATP-dependent helicase YprA (DUF1998 family)
MSLNPIQFGKDVIDQYGRYLRTTFRLADPELAGQLREGLAHGPGSEDRLAKGPFVFLNRPFAPGPTLEALAAEKGLGLHPALPGLFERVRTLHRHQELALRESKAGRHVLLATGTGSGKTEGFLLPIFDHCLKLRDSNAEPGVAAVLVYPMNALVNDQLERMRRQLAGSRITFGRYTGETPEEAKGRGRLETPRPYTAVELKRSAERHEDLPLPWEECASRSEIRERRPRILLTNYTQLEYLLLRDQDLDLFRGAPLRFFVLDEIHTYTGALGSEVACLLRRLRTVTQKSATELLCIGSSATVTDRDPELGPERVLRGFASRLFGVPEESVAIVRESYLERRADPSSGYLPPIPKQAAQLLGRVLDSVRGAQLSDDPGDLSEAALESAAELCGRPAPGGSDPLDRLFALLSGNRVVELLVEAFGRPTPLPDVLPRLRELPGRKELSDEDLEAEALAYLTLGALARRDDEPLLRPKLHFFIQGLDGLWLRWEAADRRRLAFDGLVGEGPIPLPLGLCRACGQHYVRSSWGELRAVDREGGGGVRTFVPGADAGGEAGSEGGTQFLLTDALMTPDEEGGKGEGARAWLCRFCGAIHDFPGERCFEAKCGKGESLVELLAFPEPIGSCASCNARSSERSPIVTAVRSTEAYDVMVLAQTELAAMTEAELRKILIFADSRQDAAFQAGWMESRSLRFRVRHLAFSILRENPKREWYFEKLVDELAERATEQGLVPVKGAHREPAIARLRWILVEEFFAASERQRRNSLEQLGLAEVLYEGLSPDSLAGLTRRWSGRLGVSGAELADAIALVLDTFRLQHAVSHPMLGRLWNDRDPEVRQGIVNVPDHFRPRLLVPKNPSDAKQATYCMPFVGSKTTSGVQRFLARCFPEASKSLRSEFADELWGWLVSEEILRTVHLKSRRHGKLVPIGGVGEGWQLALELVRIRHADGRFVCSQCGTARARSGPGGVCPRANCKGSLQRKPRDLEHYDVVQYTERQFVPLLAREHSAQVPQEDRIEIETEFKKPAGRFNCLVATPTLEMGVDIGPLELVLMRNVPPSPANYAQRSGRAGRRHRIGAIFTYCRRAQHDRWFYRDPASMISGEVRVPAFSMRNEPLLRKHLHSAVLTALRSDPVTAAELDRILPTWIWSWFGEEASGQGRRYRDEKPDLSRFRRLIEDRRSDLLATLRQTFTDQWPKDDAELVRPERIETLLDEVPTDLETAAATLFAEVKAYRTRIDEYGQRQREGEHLSDEDLKHRQGYERALSRLWSQNQENYTISWLARHGFFPGYALVRDSVSAQSLEPPLDLSRPLAVAIRELAPANRIYANRQQFKIRRFDFHRLEAARPDFTPTELEETMYLDVAADRVVPHQPGVEGGDKPPAAFLSLRMTDVELEPLGRISDQEEYRYRVGYEEFPVLLPDHRGGHEGKVGKVPYTFLREARFRLVNLGVKGMARNEKTRGFPICLVCGETRSPFAGTAELDNFAEFHGKHCGRPTGRFALHVDTTSDLLQLGPFEAPGLAVNLLESLRIGTRLVLEMGDAELDIAVTRDENGREIGLVFDPVPGGSGILPLLFETWGSVLEAASAGLASCECEKACYRCLLHFRNQGFHPVLDRKVALGALADARGSWERTNAVAPRFDPVETTSPPTDSNREDLLFAQLGAHHFPLPTERRFRIDLPGGSFTVPDFAWPEKKLVLYVDGLSEKIHGNPEQRRKDRILRVKARAQGWQVCEISAEGLADKKMLANLLEELAVYLGEEN